jgi:hypothetical protein
MKLFSYIITLATLSINVLALPAPYVDDSVAFSNEIGDIYNQYRAQKGYPQASPLECAMRLANEVSWSAYIKEGSDRIVTDQSGITAKGRAECPELKDASFFLAIVRSPTTGGGIFGMIDSVTPNGLSGWSHFGAKRADFLYEFEWALVLVDPNGNNGGQPASDSNDAQDFWDQAALVGSTSWGSSVGI